MDPSQAWGPSSSRGNRIHVIRNTPPVRAASPLPEPMENMGSPVEVTRVGSAAEIAELEYIANVGSSQESVKDDLLPGDRPLTGQSWMDTSSDLLKVTFAPRFKKSDIVEIKVDDADDSHRLVRIEDLAQLTRDGEEIERGDSLKGIEAEISLERTWDRNSE